MNKIVKYVYEEKSVVAYLEARNLIKQYKKAEIYLLAGLNGQVRFKQRHPKGSGVWYFRINKQYRALGYFDVDENFIVVEIDNHQ